MTHVRRIRPVRKSKYIMNRIVLAPSQKELTKWRRKNKHKYRVVFYGSPDKNTGGAYALAQTK